MYSKRHKLKVWFVNGTCMTRFVDINQIEKIKKEVEAKMRVIQFTCDDGSSELIISDRIENITFGFNMIEEVLNPQKETK